MAEKGTELDFRSRTRFADLGRDSSISDAIRRSRTCGRGGPEGHSHSTSACGYGYDSGLRIPSSGSRLRAPVFGFRVPTFGFRDKLNSHFIVTKFSILHAGGRSLFRFQTSRETRMAMLELEIARAPPTN